MGCELYTVTLTTKVWLPETSVITLFVKGFLEIQVILWLEWKPHKFTPCCINYEACMCGIYETRKYHTIMNAM